MREFETKIHFPHLSWDVVVAKLTSTGLRFGPSIHQVDYVYARSLSQLMRPRPGTVVARVRVTDLDASFTVKQRRSSELDRTECESAVSDPDQVREALTLLGLRQFVVVDKRRCTAEAGDGTSIVVDDVASLGVFVEVEVLGDETAGLSLLDDIVARVRDAVGTEGARESRGYDRLLVLRSR
jgi:predicted adenylyl cyclase CyaB